MKSEPTTLLAVCLCLLSFVTGSEPAAAQGVSDDQSMSIAAALNRAAPSVRWDANGRLVYSVTEGDSTSHRVLDPRTGIDQPFEQSIEGIAVMPRKALHRQGVITPDLE